MPVPESLRTKLTADAVALLRMLVRTPSPSREEGPTADILENTMLRWGLVPNRTGNNVWAWAPGYDAKRPTLMLNSHHDTVPPNPSYTRNPYDGALEDGRLYGLGSNDAGGALVSLLATFRYFCQNPLPVNLLFVASAEEECSGQGGTVQVLPMVKNPHLAIVGEPTGLRAAVAEKGLLVLDCETVGKPGHAARDEGENALYKAMDDIAWFRSYRFPRVSETLGEMRMQVTAIEAGKLHNTVPDRCRYLVDIRVTDAYTHEEVLDIIRAHVQATVKPRSMRLRSSATPPGHPVQAALERLGVERFGSPTLSDQSVIPFASVKIGPGQSARSHAADEFIYVQEIEDAIRLYIHLINETYRA